MSMMTDRAKPATFGTLPDAGLSETAPATLTEFERWRQMAMVGAPINFPPGLGLALLDLAIAELRLKCTASAQMAAARAAGPTSLPVLPLAPLGEALRDVSGSVDALLHAAAANRLLAHAHHAALLFTGRAHA